jgi:type III secretory pathway component EscV
MDNFENSSLETKSLEKNSKVSKKIFVLVLLVVLLAGLFFWLNRQKKNKEKPNQNTQQQIKSPYPEGTKVANELEQYPKGFPIFIVLEKTPIAQSSSVVLPNGRQKMSVLFISQKPVGEVFTEYEKVFKKYKWQILASENTPEVAVLMADNGEGLLSLTISKAGSNTQLKFVYEK